MKTRYYKKDQVWNVGINDLELKYVEIDSSELDNHNDLVPSVFHILPEGHPKKRGVIESGSVEIKKEIDIEVVEKKPAKKSRKKAVKKAVKK